MCREPDQLEVPPSHDPRPGCGEQPATDTVRLQGLSGPLSLPVIGGGQVHAAFSDFREVDGFELPFAARYELGGGPFFDEQVVEQSAQR